MGTVAYMSPELARGDPLDARTDLFSFGAVLYEMATGRQAFSGTTTGVHDAILNRTPVPAIELDPQLPARLDEIIKAALEKERDLRCQSAPEMLANLKRVRRDRYLEASAEIRAKVVGKRVHEVGASTAGPWVS